MADKYVKLSSGQLAEQEVITTSAGAGDTGKVVGLDATGRLDVTMMPVGTASEVKVMPASEALLIGNLVNVFLDDATLKCRKADCSNGWRADGFVLAAVDQDANATVHFEGNNTEVTGKTLGAIQYLSANGATDETAPTDSGYIVQEIGKALTATEITFEPKSPITLG